MIWFASYLTLMLRSQIKLTSYDFSDLHITCEFDNRPGTGRFLRIFFCVVIYRTGAGRRLYMKTSADARPGTVRRRAVPGRRCKRSTGHRTVPGRFYTNFHVQWWIYVYQNSPSYRKKINSTCSLHINHPQLLKRNIYFCIYVFWSLKVKYLCKCNMVFCKKRRISPVAVWLIKHRPVPRRASADLLSDFFNFLALVKHRTMTVRCVKTPAGRRPGTLRCPADVILP